MQPIDTPPSRTQLAYRAILDEICAGALAAGTHLKQEDLAQRLGVSRQPVQQALALLKADGVVEEIGTRGLRVAPLDIAAMRHHYDIRAVLDGLAARLAAERVAGAPALGQALQRRGRQILEEGREAVLAQDTLRQIERDVALHALIYEASGNPLIGDTAERHWRFLRRVMGEVLRHAEPPREIWQQHAAILDAVVAGDAALAHGLAVDHDLRAAETLADALVDGRETQREA
jgi:DNA-binding GntR family transcriptional regulator